MTYLASESLDCTEVAEAQTGQVGRQCPETDYEGQIKVEEAEGKRIWRPALSNGEALPGRADSYLRGRA